MQEQGPVPGLLTGRVETGSWDLYKPSEARPIDFGESYCQDGHPSSFCCRAAYLDPNMVYGGWGDLLARQGIVDSPRSVQGIVELPRDLAAGGTFSLSA